MNTVALIGAQWGDEGKGKIIDILAKESDYVVRATGGSNAGHTVVNDGKTYKLHLLPSGILYPYVTNIIGCGVVIDPKIVLEEMSTLKSQGASLDKLMIDYRAHVVMPYHKVIDGLAETAKGKDAIGTTKRGIGPCYADKTDRIGIRMIDLVNAPVFAEKLKANLEFKNNIITKIYGGEPIDYTQVLDEYNAYAKQLQPFLRDTGALLYNAIKANKRVMFEGAQGTLLDIDSGTYPFVTSSHPISGGFCVGSGVGPTAISRVIGIAKAYTTRVGAGPFPTELNDEVGEHLLKVGNEFGTTTGRARRCGWLDAVILRLAVRLNGLNGLAVNKLDTLTGIKKLKVAVAYMRGEQKIEDFPPDISILNECTPVYEEFDGWTEDLSDCKNWNDLPENAKKYIEGIERLCDCKVAMIGVGPNRNQNINRD